MEGGKHRDTPMIEAFEILLYALIPFGCALIGGWVAGAFSANLTWSSIIQHFVAGIVLGTVAVELLPEILVTDSPITTSIGFFLGVVVMVLIHALTHYLARFGAGRQIPYGIIIGSAVDLFIDGVVIGIAFIAGPESGLLVAISLSLCAFFMNLSVGTALKRRPLSRLVKYAILFCVGVTLPVGAFLGAECIHLLPAEYMVEILSFGVAALLYLGTEELLTEAHRVHDKTWTPGLFFLGFWAILLFKMIG